jgi:hypothetical protein
MKRGICIAMVVSGLIVMLTGIWEFFPPFNDVFYIFHAANSCIFVVLVLIHVWLNWKQLLKYFTRLGWWWLLVGLGFAEIIWLVYDANIRLGAQ